VAEPSQSSSPLARYLFAAYALLVVYASLHPWYGWRAQGVHPFAFLAAPWPRYRTVFDMAANLVGYLPLGAFGVAAAMPMRRPLAFVLVTLAGTLLSFTLESLQTYLPTRVASNLDLALNAAGVALGAALAAAVVPRMLAAGGARGLRNHWVRAGSRADLGLLLLGLWLMTQLNPETLLFGTGDLRELIGAPPGKSYPAELFVRLEALVAGTHLAAIALIAARLAAPGRAAWPLVLGLFLLALAVRTAAFAILFEPGLAFNWYTPGAAIGLILGAVAVVVALRLPPSAQLGIAAMLITIATAVVNMGPQNPYWLESLSSWRQGNFLNFNGLTRAVSVAWPFLAVIYLFVIARPTPPGVQAR